MVRNWILTILGAVTLSIITSQVCVAGDWSLTTYCRDWYTSDSYEDEDGYYHMNCGTPDVDVTNNSAWATAAGSVDAGLDTIVCCTSETFYYSGYEDVFCTGDWEWTGPPGQAPSVEAEITLEGHGYFLAEGYAFLLYGDMASADALSSASAFTAAAAPNWASEYASTWMDGSSALGRPACASHDNNWICWVVDDTQNSVYDISGGFCIWVDEYYYSSPGLSTFSIAADARIAAYAGGGFDYDPSKCSVVQLHATAEVSDAYVQAKMDLSW